MALNCPCKPNASSNTLHYNREDWQQSAIPGKMDLSTTFHQGCSYVQRYRAAQQEWQIMSYSPDNRKPWSFDPARAWDLPCHWSEEAVRKLSLRGLCFSPTKCSYWRSELLVEILDIHLDLESRCAAPEGLGSKGTVVSRDDSQRTRYLYRVEFWNSFT